MKQDPGPLPSLVWRVALRFALVFGIQVVVLGTLLLSAPRLAQSLADVISESRRAALTTLLESTASGLAKSARFAAAAGASADSFTHGVDGGAGPQLWMLTIGGGAAEAVAAGAAPDWLLQASDRLVERLEAGSASGQSGWAYLSHDGNLYAVGGHRLGEGSDGWLVLVEDAGPVIREALGGVAADDAAGFEVIAAGGQDVAPAALTSFLRGTLPVTVAVPNAAVEPVVLRFSIPVTRLGYVSRAGALILTASFLLLAGSLLLAFVSTYAQVMQPFNARMHALSEYALTGRWEPPPGAYREHQLADQAITEAVRARERAEREAQQRMAELRTFVDSLPAHVTVKDVDLRLCLVNKGLCRFLGREAADLLGKTDADIYPPALAAVYAEHDREVLRLGEQRQYEEEGQSSSGRRTYRVVKAPVVEADGSISGIVGIAVDITEEKATESHLIEAQKMHVVGRLAGGLSHAFNNLLTTIIGSAELALLSLNDDHPARHEVQQIRAAAERGGDLSRQLLTLSRQRLAKMTATDANGLIESMLPALRETLGDSIVVEACLGADAPCVKADQTQLRQLVLNLAINAGEAMPEGGPLRIATSRCAAPKEAVAIEPQLGNGAVFCLSVKDAGAGIPAEAREHVFEPFFTTKGASQGRGLGLAVAYSIARQHKGVILYKTVEGEGTEFTVYLPAFEAEPAVEAPTQSHSDEAPRGREVVLLVEDDALVRQLAERLLSAQGYTVWSAESGERALALLEEVPQQPELLLSDVIMPGISGVELARALVRQHPGVRVLLMSGYAGESEQGTMGGFPMLWKPFTLQTLAQRVRAVLDA